jgi:CelD/BcsL family acetyltransferase involved in cellulose biosynthesis
MPDEPESEADVAELVEAIKAGTDEIAVPAEMLDEPESPAATPPRSLYAEILGMSIGQKIKLALRGNGDARTILVRDGSKLVRRFVLMNPRIGDNEIIAITRNKTIDDDLLRMIADKREWLRLYQVRVGLATNPKTSLPLAIKLVGTLDERDIRQISKSKNVQQGVAAQARRILFTKQQKTS